MSNPLSEPMLRVAKGITRRDRIGMWAAGYQGARDIRIMASPPTVTLPASNASTITGSNASALKKSYSAMSLAGFTERVDNTSNGNANALNGYGPNNTDSSKKRANLVRAKFMITAPVFEVCFLENTGSMINAVVDGEFVTAGGIGVVPNGLQSGVTRYMKFDFGADTLSYGFANITTGGTGTGYAAGDTITVAGGTSTRPAIFKVGAVSGGVPTVTYLQDPGDYSALPSFPAATTGGTGTGLTVSSGAFRYPIHTKTKPREVELLLRGADLYGLQYTDPSAVATVTPARFNPLVPKVYWVGDSQEANTYGVYAGGEIPYLVCRRLGLSDNLVIDAQGGTGFAKNNGTAPAFEHANRIAAVVAASPDIVIFPFSQNIDNQTTSTAAAVAFLLALQTALPNTLFVMVGPAFGAQSWHLTAMTTVVSTALDPARIRMVDNITDGWATDTAGTSPTGFLAGDSTHWGTWGNLYWRSKLEAEGIAYQIFDMVMNG